MSDRPLTDKEVSNLIAIAEESARLEKLSNRDLVAECLNTDAADYWVVEEMMNRLFPGWENEDFSNERGDPCPRGESSLVPQAGSDWRGSKPWDHTIPKSAADVVALLERRIEVHQAWLDWFEADPDGSKEASEAGVGTAASQRAYIAQYRAAIQIIQKTD